MNEIKLADRVGAFAENKDIARDIRLNTIIPLLEKNQGIILNFEGINSTTQSFIHALLSDLIRKYGVEIVERLQFKSCSPTVQKMISLVFEYMQESLD